ncbi:prolyl aminopeptidase serine peptidase [Naematelia encephala]|uniref:Proline iminopeptidase n=1 Tax=Naematelia encephala TaxID=71784 RepID=A0A1Y2AM42_9TREE|nr:prolyl aminopeptidase serine peptidase [Naematelia encephala]
MVYPAQEPYDEGFLKVSDIHKIYYMQCGNPDGKPVLYLHGGPGGSVGVKNTVYFNPDIYRIVLFDQRGSGKSEPTAEIKDNTTWDLVDDIEKIRTKLGIENWVVFGGSWGSTLALAYAETYPERATALILRGLFLVSQAELRWFYQEGGTSMVWPAEWEAYAALIPPEKRSDMISAYYELLTDPDDKVSLPAAQEWSRYESSVIKLRQDAEEIARSDNDLKWAREFARIECHYFINKAWMPDRHLVSEEQLAKIRHLPCKMINGRYDSICLPKYAYDLKRTYGDNCELIIVPDAGHSAAEPGTTAALVKAADEFASL